MRLIDADKIRDKLKQKEINPATIFINEVLIGLLDDAPTVDAVPVVRCENCLHNHGERDKPECRFTDLVRSNKFYCRFGERKEER